MNDYSKTLAENIKRIMKAKGWTQAELGDRTGLTQPAISRHFRGEKMTVDTLIRYAKAFECTANDLLYGLIDEKDFDPTAYDVCKIYPYNMILDLLDGDREELDKLYLACFKAVYELLNDAEKDVLEMTYKHNMSLRKIAKKESKTAEGVRKIKIRALEKLAYRKNLYIIDVENLRTENEMLKEEISKKDFALNDLKEYSSELETALTPYINDFLTVNDLGLPTAITNALIRAGYEHVSDFIGKSTYDLYKVRRIGFKRLYELINKLKDYGVELS